MQHGSAQICAFLEHSLIKIKYISDYMQQFLYSFTKRNELRKCITSFLIVSDNL